MRRWPDTEAAQKRLVQGDWNRGILWLHDGARVQRLLEIYRNEWRIASGFQDAQLGETAEAYLQKAMEATSDM